MLKISIITVCYNSAVTISETIQSIASQNYPDIEYIVVDGGSTDGTKEIVADSVTVSNYISEPDGGIYDAMNKGIAMAKGDIIGILNADDFYVDDDVLSNVIKVFEDTKVDACYADLVYVDQQDTSKIVRYWQPGIYQQGAFLKGWMPPHPTFFCRKSVYEKYGLFDLNYKIAADVEILFRFLERAKISTVYIPKLLIRMRLGGTTNQSLENIKKQNKEVISILENHYGKVSRFRFYLSKLLNRTLQYMKKPKFIK